MRTSAWSLVLAFGEVPLHDVPAGVDRHEWVTAGALDTLDTVLETVEPAHVLVVSEEAEVIDAAYAGGAWSQSSGRDLNTDVAQAAAGFARSAPERSVAVVVGPLPLAEPSDLFDALRACAATESAVIVASDGGTVVLSHHDPSALRPRFGGASGSRHQQAAVRVGAHLAPALSRVVSSQDTARVVGPRRRLMLAPPSAPQKETS